MLQSVRCKTLGSVPLCWQCCTVCVAKWLDVEETMGLRGLYKVAATAYWPATACWELLLKAPLLDPNSSLQITIAFAQISSGSFCRAEPYIDVVN